MERARQPGDVDGTHHSARLHVVDGRGRARPAVARVGRAGTPEDLPLRVGHDHAVRRLVGDFAEGVAQLRQHRCERVVGLPLGVPHRSSIFAVSGPPQARTSATVSYP